MKKRYVAFLFTAFTLLSYRSSFSQDILNPRAPAEWEEIESLVMGPALRKPQNQFQASFWNKEIDPFIKTAQACINEKIHFYLLDPDSVDGEPDYVNWDTLFQNRGVTSQYVHILKVQSIDKAGTPWTRDTGPFTVYENGTGSRYFLKFPGDDCALFITDYLAEPILELNSPFLYEKLYFDGGNWLTDGHGTFNIYNTSRSYPDNTPEGLIEPPLEVIRKYFGVGKTLNVKGVEVHADYWLKMIDEETFLVSHIPLSNYRYDVDLDPYRGHDNDIQNGIEMIKEKLHSAFGREFKFHFITNPQSYIDQYRYIVYSTTTTSYVNSLILNKTVLVPQYNVEPFDSDALRKYRELMPGYTVVGVDNEVFAKSGGAIHCITREIFAKNPIYIKHVWMPDSVNQTTDYNVSATVKSSLGVKSVSLYWAVNNNTTFEKVPMTLNGESTYSAMISGQQYGTRINYYIEAEDNNGKKILKPFVAPASTYDFLIHPDGVVSVSDDKLANNIPGNFYLSQNYPDPFNPSTTINYSLPKASNVKIEVFNLLGERVKVLVDNYRDAGNYKTVWSGKDEYGRQMSSGVYLYRMQANGTTLVKKMILTK